MSNVLGHRVVSGRIHHQGHAYFAGAKFIPELNAILLVGQPKSRSSYLLSQSLASSKLILILGITLLGLLASGATMFTYRVYCKRQEHLQGGLQQKITSSGRELVKTQNAVIFGLARLAESRDNDTGQHLDRIRLYVTILAEDIASDHPDFMDSDFIHNLGLASSLHDIGKVGIPDSVLLKPGKLTPEERSIMELHTLIGGECLDAIQARLGDNEFMETARQVAYHHHERWDGTGYPHSLRGEEIPLVARIVAVADVYDALTSKRPYKKAMSHIESREIIVSGKGRHFDPQLVDCFLRHEEEFSAIAASHQTEDGRQDLMNQYQQHRDALQAPITEDEASERVFLETILQTPTSVYAHSKQ